jgi:ribonuclease P protein component
MRRAGRNFVVLSAEVDASDVSARLGVTVSRRVGNAVVRNSVKRRIREWFRQVGRERVAGRDVVVIARPGAGEVGGAVVFAELDELTGAAGLPSAVGRP